MGKNTGKKYTKKAALDTRVGKYFLNRQAGMTKHDSALVAGYADGKHTNVIEATKTFKELERVYYKDELASQITMKELAAEHIKNILQDADRGAKNKAIEIALQKLEPEKYQEEQEERVTVVLKDVNISVNATPKAGAE